MSLVRWGLHAGPVAYFTPVQFEHHAGCSSNKKWKSSIKVCAAGRWLPIGKWIDNGGFELPKARASRTDHVSVSASANGGTDGPLPLPPLRKRSSAADGDAGAPPAAKRAHGLAEGGDIALPYSSSPLMRLASLGGALGSAAPLGATEASAPPPAVLIRGDGYQVRWVCYDGHNLAAH